MRFDPQLATIRFGLGLSPRHNLPRDVDALMAEARATPPRPITPFASARPSLADMRQANRDRRQVAGTDQEEIVMERRREMRRAMAMELHRTMAATFARGVDAPTGIAERLASFWIDHFTVLPRNGVPEHLLSAYAEEAIRPYIMGRFPDMLRAAALHPMMLMFLDQVRSVGANSDLGLRRKRGANENLAREILELHSLGVEGPYSQTDVSELADLLTGVTYNPDRGFRFNQGAAEPGAETVLGYRFAERDSLENVHAALDAIALQHATANHLAFKLAQYFVADAPDPALIEAMAERYLETQGDLAAVVEQMLAHPAAWTLSFGRIKPPAHFLVSGMRALGVQGSWLMRSNRSTLRRALRTPLRVMGQPWLCANGPDGWPEIGTDWISPQAMAGRINWAMQAPRWMMKGRLSDPRDFVTDALGRNVPPDVVFAAAAAEGREEGIGLVLASPAFQRS